MSLIRLTGVTDERTTSRQHCECGTHFTGWPRRSEWLSKYCADDIAYYLICGRSPAYFRDICVPVVSVAFLSRLRSADSDDIVLGLRAMVYAVSMSWHLGLEHVAVSS